MQFRDFDSAAFLRDAWQQRPLLIRNPWLVWENPLDGDELAGLACEAEVESRLVVHSGGDWRAEDGPFGAARFAKLGKQPWTLLVQAVDHHVPEVAALIAPFRFVPNWRIDDVMVSYASDGGGVGPHFDNYDVFLIQGQGRRRWEVGAACDEATPLLPHDDLRLLASFEPTEEWVLDPGDILYVPPGVAHNGVALGDDCMTYSVGFRAPARSELIAHWADEVLADLPDDDRYTDPGLPLQGNPGEIPAEALARLQAMIAERLGDRAAFVRWFGRYNSTPKYPEMDWRPDEPIDMEQARAWAASGGELERNPASRLSFVRQGEGAVLLFANGECFDCVGAAAGLAQQLCAAERVSPAADLAGSKAALDLIVALFNQGSIAFADRD